MRELRDGHSPAARTGLQWLLLGAILTTIVVFLMSPAIGGLASLPGQILDRPVPAPTRATAPPLTASQRMAARRTAVRVAISQAGVRERPGNRGARIVKYRRAVIGAGENPRSAEPWCADFVSWAWRRAGVPIGFGGLGSDYVPELVAWARLTRRWHWARDGYTPRSGDLIVYKTRASMRGHIGLVVKLQGGRVHTIEGNLGDRVMRSSVKGWAPNVTGYISPV
ncbi:MAG: hypothetical protein JWL76_2231 [Thermoleophilia bacterium]|nr:hypothetical protein [Thermoleophilia bacterium]